jgi:hypothetical protein
VQQIERDGFQRCQTQIHIYTTLKFLALQGAPHIYDISRLRVNKQLCWAAIWFILLLYIIIHNGMESIKKKTLWKYVPCYRACHLITINILAPEFDI